MRQRPQHSEPAAALDAVTEALFEAARTISGRSSAEPEVVIALCATVLDRLLEVFIKMDPERACKVHATVLQGLSTPGLDKPRVQ